MAPTVPRMRVPRTRTFCGGEGDEHGVILILPLGRLPLGRQHADDAKRHIVDANRLIDRILPRTKEVLHHRLSEHRRGGSALLFLLIEKTTGSYRPIAHGLIFGVTPMIAVLQF